MKQFIATYGLLALSLIVFCASATVPIFLYMSTHTALSYVAEVHGKLSAEGDQEKNSRSMKQQVERTTQERTLLATLSIEKDTVATFIDSIEEKAKSINVALEIGSVTIDTASAGSLRALQMQIRAEGAQSAVLKFLQVIETLPQASYIRSVSLERGEKTWTAVLTLVIPTKQ